MHVVNNNAAALLLVALTLAPGREIVLSRGELVEIGDGFRIPELLESTGARLREVGTTNRTGLRDYTEALGPQTGFVLKVHPSNFHVTGFTSAVGVAALAAELRTRDIPLVVDIGSGLLAPHPVLPDEPDATSTLADGADLVTAGRAAVRPRRSRRAAAPPSAVPGRRAACGRRRGGAGLWSRRSVVGRLEGGRCLLDLRTVSPEDDELLAAAVRACSS